ncbi:MAG: dihydrodipicolinate synthase family protein, partial [Opitutales bacterium]|nr:dihydrodipicolinate synthase family protein [Opitutales bacterium]
MDNFAGVWTALITPMTETGVDYDALAKLVEAQVAGGVRGIVAVGTTGESPTLDPVEHIVAIKKVIEYAGGRIPVIAGTGANCKPMTMLLNLSPLVFSRNPRERALA